NLIDEAAADIKHKFDVPIVLIVVDTMVAAAQHQERGDENDAAVSQRVLNNLRRVSEHTKALAVGIDYFGKTIETGTRGSSAKEASADAIIVTLADRELGGAVKNTRLGLRKLRDGMAGIEIPFTVHLVERGHDNDGDPILAPVIDWETAQAPQTAGKERWSK